MPIHDWTRVAAGDFHDFHQSWVVAIRNALNAGGLPEGYYAMVEQILGGPIPDVVALERPGSPQAKAGVSQMGGVAVLEAPPKAWLQRQAVPDIYASRANRIAIRHRHGEVVAIIEIVSPRNKLTRPALRAFVEKCRELLNNGINLLIVDLFPPSERDPGGIHKAIWDEVQEEPYDPPEGKPLTVAAYVGRQLKSAYVDSVGVGDPVPDRPIFLSPDWYAPAPLETTYAETWANCPPPIREALSGGD
jgi:hypothetical protein